MPGISLDEWIERENNGDGLTNGEVNTIQDMVSKLPKVIEKFKGYEKGTKEYEISEALNDIKIVFDDLYSYRADQCVLDSDEFDDYNNDLKKAYAKLAEGGNIKPVIDAGVEIYGDSFKSDFFMVAHGLERVIELDCKAKEMEEKYTRPKELDEQEEKELEKQRKKKEEEERKKEEEKRKKEEEKRKKEEEERKKQEEEERKEEEEKRRAQEEYEKKITEGVKKDPVETAKKLGVFNLTLHKEIAQIYDENDYLNILRKVVDAFKQRRKLEESYLQLTEPDEKVREDKKKESLEKDNEALKNLLINPKQYHINLNDTYDICRYQINDLTDKIEKIKEERRLEKARLEKEKNELIETDPIAAAEKYDLFANQLPALKLLSNNKLATIVNKLKEKRELEEQYYNKFEENDSVIKQKKKESRKKDTDKLKKLFAKPDEFNNISDEIYNGLDNDIKKMKAAIKPNKPIQAEEKKNKNKNTNKSTINTNSNDNNTINTNSNNINNINNINDIQAINNAELAESGHNNLILDQPAAQQNNPDAEFSTSLIFCRGIKEKRLIGGSTAAHSTLVTAYEDLKTDSNPNSPDYSLDKKKAALERALSAAKGYVKAKLKYDKNEQTEKKADWTPGSTAGQKRFGGALELVHKVTEEMKRLNMPISEDDKIFVQQCEVRRAFNPKRPLDNAARRDYTDKLAQTILNNKTQNKCVPEVYNMVIPNKDDPKKIKELANLAVIGGGGQVYQKYLKKSADYLKQRNASKAAEAKKNQPKVTTTKKNMKTKKTKQK